MDQELRDRWAAAQAVDDGKAALVDDLFNRINELSDQLSQSQSEVDDKRRIADSLRADQQELDQELKALKCEIDRYSFAMVVIDGDNMPFLDELSQGGSDGGIKASGLLKKSVDKALKDMDPNVPCGFVGARVYANIKGMAKVYDGRDGLPDYEKFLHFVSGFNRGHPWFDYVDAGVGKEAADVKVKENFERLLHDVHCRFIFFGASRDNGYARLLEHHCEDEVARKKIVLLEGPAFTKELNDIKDRFRTLRMPGIFRSERIDKRRVSFTSPHSSTQSARSKNADYASVVTGANELPDLVYDATEAWTSTSKASIGNVLVNQNGQRVDPRLNYTKKDFNNLKKGRWCNRYQLLGTCDFEGCKFNHDPFPQEQLEALRAVARQSSCPNGVYCSDAQCINGHNCPFPDYTQSDCRFPREMYGIERSSAARKLAVDTGGCRPGQFKV